MAAPILVISGPSGAGKTTVGHLVAAAFDRSVHLRTDDFMSCFVNGWVDPSSLDATNQKQAIGAAVASAALQFAVGDYTVILDGHFFPDGIEGMRQMCVNRHVALHYVVLRADLSTCLARATTRATVPDAQSFAQLHARFAALGDREPEVVDASPGPEAVAERVLAVFAAGRLLEARPHPELGGTARSLPDVTEPDHVSATRAVYDATAETYARVIGTQVSDAVEGPVDRAFLSAFGELITGGATAGPVADVGCGPGRVAAFLSARGLDVVGVDPSPAMLAIARRAHPELRFDEGRLTALPFPDWSLAGVVCWYSIIHTPPDDLDEVFAELARVLAPDGHLLAAFQAGHGEPVHRADAHGTGIALTSYRHSPDDVSRHMTGAGLQLHTRALREPELPHESTPQAFLLSAPAPPTR